MSAYINFLGSSSGAVGTPDAGNGRIFYDTATRSFNQIDQNGTVTSLTATGGSSVDVIVSTSAATYNILNSIDTVFIDCTSNNITATLPDATLNPGKVLCVLRIDNTVNVSTIDSVAGQVQGDTSFELTDRGSAVFISNGTDWWIK